MHAGGMVVVGQQAAGLLLEVGEIDGLPLLLDRVELGQQRDRTDEGRLVEPVGLLLAQQRRQRIEPLGDRCEQFEEARLPFEPEALAPRVVRLVLERGTVASLGVEGGADQPMPAQRVCTCRGLVQQRRPLVVGRAGIVAREQFAIGFQVAQQPFVAVFRQQQVDRRVIAKRRGQRLGEHADDGLQRLGLVPRHRPPGGAIGDE